MQILSYLFFLSIGFILLVKGADWFVEGASGIARLLRIPQLVIGLTIVAMGTSMPEAAVSINAALKGNPGISIGNIVGSNILNILIILGISSLIASLAVQRSTIRYEIPFLLIITAVLFFMGLTGGCISFIEGILLWILFLAYLGYLLCLAGKERPKKEPTELPPILLVFAVLIGGAVVIWGSDIAVVNATALARSLNISERFIGLTIVALGTSLPELFTSVAAARKGNADIAIGNIVGSNIFNILFILGTASLITPIPFEHAFLIDTVIAALTGILLWFFALKRKMLKRSDGIIMLLCYAAYFLYLSIQ